MAQYDVSEIERLIDGQLSWTRVQEIMKDAKDADRFEKWVAILQKRVPWKEKILLPLTTALFIVRKGEKRIVKCRCGHEFGDYRVNWKLEALIHVRETEEQLREVYRGSEQPDPSWIQIREYICPGCGTQLEVEAVPRGCPPDFEFLPDLDTFYREWLGRPLPDEVEFADKTLDTIRTWRTDRR
ncbi:MAG TPA: acetone carboxylase subunit gamma [Deltaproteobacteria bacterium]|jgi:acetone carboxylase gamma subunit|nr:acetone carboxylase subunit gamma [Deltaproteobacteria bacterium]